MTREQWESLGFRVESYGPGVQAYVIKFTTGHEIVVTNEDSEHGLPEDGDNCTIGLYRSPAIEDTSCFAVVEMSANFKDSKLESKYVEAVIKALIQAIG